MLILFPPRNKFLSTPSARRATSRTRESGADHSHFYPRPPRGGRRPKTCPQYRNWPISIHALREEGDIVLRVRIPNMITISIHALREEGDYPTAVCDGRSQTFLSTPSARRATVRSGLSRPLPRDFYPRPPRGGRLAQKLTERMEKEFLSTPSARRATTTGALMVVVSGISIHALREEGDVRDAGIKKVCRVFLSTPSARRAT